MFTSVYSLTLILSLFRNLSKARKIEEVKNLDDGTKSRAFYDAYGADIEAGKKVPMMRPSGGAPIMVSLHQEGKDVQVEKGFVDKIKSGGDFSDN